MTETTSAMEVDEHFVAMCRSRKDDRVRDADFSIPGDDDIAPVILLKDEDGPICFVFVHQINRDHALDAIYRLVPGLSATEVWVSLDSHITSNPINPKTGEPWKNGTDGSPGEMQTLCDNEDACSSGLLTDCIWIQGVRRDGYEAIVNMPYHIGYSNHEVHWQEGHAHWFTEIYDPADDARMTSGLVPEVIREAFTIKTAKEVFEEGIADYGDKEVIEGFTAKDLFEDLGPRRAKLHGWLALLQLVHSEDWTVALAAQDDEELAVIQESHERWQARRQAASLLAAALGPPPVDPFSKALAKEPRPQKVTEGGIILP